MADDLDMLRASIEAAIAEAADLRALDAVRVSALGKSGEVTAILKGLGGLPPEERKARGAQVNVLKGEIERALESRRVTLDAFALDARLAAERHIRFTQGALRTIREAEARLQVSLRRIGDGRIAAADSRDGDAPLSPDPAQ